MPIRLTLLLLAALSVLSADPITPLNIGLSVFYSEETANDMETFTITDPGTYLFSVQASGGASSGECNPGGCYPGEFDASFWTEWTIANSETYLTLDPPQESISGAFTCPASDFSTYPPTTNDCVSYLSLSFPLDASQELVFLAAGTYTLSGSVTGYVNGGEPDLEVDAVGSVASAPEPRWLVVLLGLGLVGIGVVRKRLHF